MRPNDAYGNGSDLSDYLVFALEQLSAGGNHLGGVLQAGVGYLGS